MHGTLSSEVRPIVSAVYSMCTRESTGHVLFYRLLNYMHMHGKEDGHPL